MGGSMCNSRKGHNGPPQNNWLHRGAIRLTLTEGMWGQNLLAIDSYPKKSGGTGLSQVSKSGNFFSRIFFQQKTKVDFASKVEMDQRRGSIL